MNPIRRRRLLFIAFIMLSLAAASGLVLFSLRQNISLFYTPSQIANGEVPQSQNFRIGGLVTKGSVHYSDNGQQVLFTITDTKHEVVVVFHGLLPDLFREGQGIVAQGKLDSNGKFEASEVLAKHDENYRPPEVTAALQQAKS